MDPRLPSLEALNGRITLSLSSLMRSSRLTEVMLATRRMDRPAASLLGVVNPTALFRRHLRCFDPAPHRLRSRWSSRSRRMPRESLDAPDDLRNRR